MKDKFVGFRCSLELYNVLKNKAREQGRSVGNFIRWIILDWLKNN